jgi:hypothetical protein
MLKATAAWPISRYVRLALMRAVALLAVVTACGLSGDAAYAGSSVDVTRFAACSAGSDDTAGVQQALDSLEAGQTLRIPAGRTCRHSSVLRIRRAGTRLAGPGTLLATDEGRSAVVVAADDVTVDGGLKLGVADTSRRWSSYEQMKLRIAGHRGVVIRDVTIDGSAAAGIFVGNRASDFEISNVLVQNTRADGIHVTDGANDGLVRSAVIRNTGDDGISVVSYAADPTVVHDIRITSPRFFGNSWGRGFSVVGGQDITLEDVYAESSNAAAVYVAAEGAPWYTRTPRRVLVTGGTLRNSNANPGVDHGAVLVFNGRPGAVIQDVSMRSLRIENTRASASRQVGVFTDGSPRSIRDVRLSDFTIVGGGPVFATNVGGAGVSLSLSR